MDEISDAISQLLIVRQLETKTDVCPKLVKSTLSLLARRIGKMVFWHAKRVNVVMKNEFFAIIRGKGVTKGERWGKGWGGAVVSCI